MVKGKDRDRVVWRGTVDGLCSSRKYEYCINMTILPMCALQGKLRYADVNIQQYPSSSSDVPWLPAACK